ncbi:MAG: hypothetical protein ACKV2T_30630 [Kofleriaceae bacterium]
MKAISTILASLLFSTACGGVIDPQNPTTDDDFGDHGLGKVDGIDLGAGDGSGSGSGSNMPPPPPELPFLTEMPQAATSATSLFAVSFATGEIRNVVGETSTEARYDIVEQRIVTKVDEPINVTITVGTPAGIYARTISTDTTRNSPAPIGPTVVCSTNGVFRFDLPECNTAPPPKSATPASGAITRGRWRLSLVHEATHTTVGGCIANNTFSITCALPAMAGDAYKVVVSADGFADLWNGTAGMTDTVLDGKRFTGVIQDLEFQCDPSLYEAEGNREYCYGHWVYNRFTGIDTAALSFDPMTITIAASGASKQFATAAITWDAGNDDLPGEAY